MTSEKLIVSQKKYSKEVLELFDIKPKDVIDAIITSV